MTVSYTQTSHFVSREQFDNYIQGLLDSKPPEGTVEHVKKENLQELVTTELWKQVQQSSFWRHYIFNRGMRSGSFAEYFATFNPEWQTDFWNAPIQEIDKAYLSRHPVSLVYQEVVLAAQSYLANHVHDKQLKGQTEIKIASLACGTMFDVLDASYTSYEKVRFVGYDTDKESLRLAKEKATSLGIADQVETLELDVVSSGLPEKEFDFVLCLGLSTNIDDHKLSKLIHSAYSALKNSGQLLMCFVQPLDHWRMEEEEREVDQEIQQIWLAVPMNWSFHSRSEAQLATLCCENGFVPIDLKFADETHHIYTAVRAHKYWPTASPGDSDY